MSQQPKKMPLTRRRMLFVSGLGATALGLLVAIPSWMLGWHDLAKIGLVAVIVGLIWLFCSRFASDEPVRAAGRRYMREFMPAIIAYMALVFAAPWLMQQVHAAPLKVLVALLPVVPVAFVMRAMLHLLLGSDELEQKLQLQAISIAAMTVALLSFAAAFLESAGLLPLKNPLIWVLPAMFAVYGVAGWWVRRGYRAA